MSMRMRNSRATLARIVLISTVLVVAWAALLAIPQPLFRFSVRAQNLVLHSDRPFSKAAGKRVLEMAEEKLSRSPIYSGRQDYHVFICNSRWRQMLFFNKDYGAGGVAQYPVTAQVFLREARVKDNRLISPGGNPVMGDRTLGYFVAHEITHQLTGADIGPSLLPPATVVREGYADYVGRETRFITMKASERSFREPEMDQSGCTAFSFISGVPFDHQHWSVEQLLTPTPEANARATL
jgi:hypothetical protein